jgi:purine-binding chemotaxis protein CheW
VHGGDQVLVVSASALHCALPLDRVIETMRPLPIEAVAGTPGFVLGVAIIRGAPTPVIDLAAMLGATAVPAPQRFVTIESAGRCVALAVAAVVGVRDLGEARPTVCPPLLAGAAGGAVESLGQLDGVLLAVLQRAHLVPLEALAALDLGRTR